MVTTRRQSNAASSSDPKHEERGDDQDAANSAAAGSKRKQPSTEVKDGNDDEKKEGDDKKQKQDGDNDTATATPASGDKKEGEEKEEGASSTLAAQSKRLRKYHDMLSWLHSDEAWSLSNPPVQAGKGELDAAEGGEGNTREPPKKGSGHSHRATRDDDSRRLSYPNSNLSPFQALLSAVMLSKPISHRLGIRAIETMLNKPFLFRTVQDLEAVGIEGRREALWQARTQHKEKTAEQLGDLVEGLYALCGSDEGKSNSLAPVLDQALQEIKGAEGGDGSSFKLADAVKRILTTNIKGLGPTGADIFLRRMQVEWPALFPYADARTMQVAVDLGILPASSSSLDTRDGLQTATRQLAEKVAEHVGFPLDKAGDDDDEEAECGRWWFVRTLDVLIGLDVEKKVDEAKRLADADAE